MPHLLKVVSTPYCEAVMLDRWDAAPSRYFAAYRAGGSGHWILGHSVVDEFGTLSSPVFLAPRSLLGKVYNSGISLAHQRDSAMDIDMGWPPLCVGVDLPAPELGEDWEDRLLRKITAPREQGADPAGDLNSVERRGHRVETYRLAGATVVAVSAPLLPRQLKRICEVVPTQVAVVVSFGNRIERREAGQPQILQAVSEATLQDLLGTVQGLR